VRVAQGRILSYGIPIVIGIAVGALIISDFYLANVLAVLFDVSSIFRIIPYEISLVIFLIVIVACFAAAHIGKLNVVIRNREKTFIVLLIAGLHTIGLFPGSFDSSDLMFIAFIVLWLSSVFTSEHYKIITSPLHYINLALVFCAVLSIVNGGIFIIFSMIPMLKGMLLSFLIIDMVRKREWTFFFIKVLFVITTISAIIAIIQEFVYLSSGTILAHYDAKFVKLILESTPFGTMLRAPAFTGMHLWLANYLVLCILIGLNAFLYYLDDMDRRARFALASSLVLMSVALLLTFSKTNMLGLVAGVLLSLFLRWRSMVIHFITLILFVLVVAYLTGLWDESTPRML
jgi:hypothetical protein